MRINKKNARSERTDDINMLLYKDICETRFYITISIVINLITIAVKFYRAIR